MRRICTLSAALLLAAPCVSASAQSVSASGRKTARTLELNEENYGKICAALSCPKDESGWRKIPWRPNLGEAIVEAQKSKKPILLWIMNGHPCGMT